MCAQKCSKNIYSFLRTISVNVKSNDTVSETFVIYKLS